MWLGLSDNGDIHYLGSVLEKSQEPCVGMNDWNNPQISSDSEATRYCCQRTYSSLGVMISGQLSRTISESMETRNMAIGNG